MDEARSLRKLGCTMGVVIPVPQLRERRPDEVVVVDDDIDVGEALEVVFTAEGYRTAVFTRGREALAYVRDRVWPGLILLDASIPDVDANTFLEEVASIPPSRIPTLLMSVETHVKESHAARTAHAVLRKPFDLNGLLNVVSSMIC
jgi:DNA-binding response OmpR family regulator